MKTTAKTEAVSGPAPPCSEAAPGQPALPRSWEADVLDGYTHAFLLHACHETGVFTELRRSGEAGASCGELAERCGLRGPLLQGVLDYLALAGGVLAKVDGRYRWTEGTERALGEPVRTLSHLVGAYSCLLYELVPALRGEKEYGADFRRAPEHVAQASDLATRSLHRWIVRRLARLGVKRLADLGCGSGGVLIDFCSRSESLAGVGVDLEPEALAEAREAVAAAGLSGRIGLVEGDLARPESYAGAVGEVQALYAGYVLHELLRDGEEALVDLLRRMGEHFPGVYLLVSEFDAVSDAEALVLPPEQRSFMLHYQHLIHPLSHQGSPLPAHRWRALFARAGLELSEERQDAPRRLLVYVLRFPENGPPFGGAG